MILQFPSLDTLQFAITSGVLPGEIANSPVRALLLNDAILIDTVDALPQKTQQGLRRLGVTFASKYDQGKFVEFLCWPQLLPLHRQTHHFDNVDNQPIIFQLSQTERMASLVWEMLRLGNDRQSFRYLEQGDQTITLLKVVGPPYYSLLQALDREDDNAPIAYREWAPRLWIQVGFHHPLADWIRVPDGQTLFIEQPRHWFLADDDAFQDIYENLELSVPSNRRIWESQELSQKINVPLRLVASSGNEPAELWVLREHAVEQLNHFVQTAKETLLRQLLFALAEQDGEEIAILRFRPSKQAPPVLVLDALPYRSYWQIPNLFVPCGAMLHPPLRRDSLRQLLANDPEKISWLNPSDNHEFILETIDDRAFQPLTDWVDYIVAKNKDTLNRWVSAHVFDFDSFQCHEEKTGAPARQKQKVESEDVEDVPFTSESPQPPEVKPKRTPAKSQPKKTENLSVLKSVPPDELKVRQLALEKQFLAFEGFLHTQERQALLPELAEIYAAQKNWHDATSCLLSRAWSEELANNQWLSRWHSLLPIPSKNTLGSQLQKLGKNGRPSPSDLRLLAAHVIRMATDTADANVETESLGKVQAYLQEHERLMPVRLAWLTALAGYELSGHDTLLLARARDRLLNRLYQQGLLPDQDFPGFLRMGDGAGNERFRNLREWFTLLPGRIHQWLSKVHFSSGKHSNKDNQAYANLMLAYGFARLGETETSQKLLTDAFEHLAEGDAIHTTLLACYNHRIEQAMNGQFGGSLPADVLANLEKMDAKDRFKVNRLREYSPILEPHEKFDAYRGWHGKHGTELEFVLNSLLDIHDGNELRNEIQKIFTDFANPKNKDHKYHNGLILTMAFEVAPRIGEDFILPLFPDVIPALQHLPLVREKAKLLEKSLYVAAHFNQPQYVEAYASQFAELPKEKMDRESLQQISSLASVCFRGLRKMGLRDTIHYLLDQFSNALIGNSSFPTLRKQKEWAATLESLLHVAGGRYFFGMADLAQPIIDEARHVIFNENVDSFARLKLICTYIKTLGQAPPEIAVAGVNEIFEELNELNDRFTTSSHYSFSQLQVIESIVSGMVHDDFALGHQVRQWLDEEEYNIRQKIHNDLNEAMARGQSAN